MKALARFAGSRWAPDHDAQCASSACWSTGFSSSKGRFCRIAKPKPMAEPSSENGAGYQGAQDSNLMAAPPDEYLNGRIFSHHFLRILFLVALFRVRAFLLHLSKRLCHVFDFIPKIKA